MHYVPGILGDIWLSIRSTITLIISGLEELITYFDRTYVRGELRDAMPAGYEGPRARAIPPRFPPPTWNVNLATQTDGDRTNNKTEGWNHR